MGIASLVLGIIGIISCILVIIAPIGLIGAIVGLVLGIIDVVKKSKAGGKKAIGIAGIVICALTFVILIIETFVVGTGLLIFNSATSNIEKVTSETFNAKYEPYEGTQSGSAVKMLLSLVLAEDREITCKFNGVELEPNEIKDQIVSSNKYKITLNYGFTGYVKMVNISE